MLDNKRNLLKVLSIITIMMLSIFMLTGCGKNDEEKSAESETAYLQPLTDYFEGIKNKDIDQVLRAFPDFAEMSDKITAEDIDDLYAQYESLYGANIKIDYSFGDAVALSEEEITDLETEISSLYTSVENIDITVAYTVPVTVTITGDGIEESTEEAGETEETENAEESVGTENEEDVENTENVEENNEENSNSNVEEDEMYVLQYNGGWYIL